MIEIAINNKMSLYVFKVIDNVLYYKYGISNVCSKYCPLHNKKMKKQIIKNNKDEMYIDLKEYQKKGSYSVLLNRHRFKISEKELEEWKHSLSL